MRPVLTGITGVALVFGLALSGGCGSGQKRATVKPRATTTTTTLPATTAPVSAATAPVSAATLPGAASTTTATTAPPKTTPTSTAEQQAAINALHTAMQNCFQNELADRKLAVPPLSSFVAVDRLSAGVWTVRVDGTPVDPPPAPSVFEVHVKDKKIYPSKEMDSAMGGGDPLPKPDDRAFVHPYDDCDINVFVGTTVDTAGR